MRILAAAVLAVAAPLLAAPLFAGLATPAEAAIRCRAEVQVNRGSNVRTPYCEDEYLAQVARAYGRQVTGRTLRASPERKRTICKFLRRDHRVASICLSDLSICKQPHCLAGN